MRVRLLIPLFFLLVLASTQSFANVYASGLKISDDTVSTYESAGNSWDGNFSNGGVKIWFILNESGGAPNSVSGKIKIFQGTTQIKVINLFNLQKGVNSAIWDGFNENGQPVAVGNYRFEVSVNDAVGHTTFDSLWVAGAKYLGPDFDGGTSYAYRGNASVMDQTSRSFGNIYVSRATTSGQNGFYELRGDGVYLRKIGTNPLFVNSTPNEIAILGEKIYGLAGYGFTGSGYAKSYNATSNTFIDSLLFGSTGVRDLAVRVEGTDTVYYTARSGTAGKNGIIKKVGINGDTVTVIDFQQYMVGWTTTGYIKAFEFDDEGNIYVIFGNSSTTRKKLYKFNSSGTLVFADSLDGSLYGLASTAYFHSIAIDRGANPTSAADDKIYALIYSGTLAQFGIYSVTNNCSTLTQLVSPAGSGSGATSQIINVDPAGNVVWSNGNANERIIVFSPASGPNGYNTVAPNGMEIVVTNPVPVELTSFTANAVDGKVVLTWSTATETNNKGFAVERKSGDGDFTEIAFVNGKGTTTEQSNYRFTDVVTSGKYSYRLRQIDFDGKISYSEVVEVEIGSAAQYILEQNYPNPFNPTTNIRFSLPVESQVRIDVYSMNGELVKTLINEMRSSGMHEITFDATGLSSGTYIYRLQAGEIVLTRKLNLIK